MEAELVDTLRPIALIALGVGLVFTTLGIVFMVRRRRFLRSAVRVPGVVTDVVYDPRVGVDGSGGPCCTTRRTDLGVAPPRRLGLPGVDLHDRGRKRSHDRCGTARPGLRDRDLTPVDRGPNSHVCRAIE